MKKLGMVLLCIAMILGIAGCAEMKESQLTSSAVSDQNNKVAAVETQEKATENSEASQPEISTGEVEKTMNILIDGAAYQVQLDNNQTTREILHHIPIDLLMTKYAGHEYYAELPFTPVFDQTRTSEVKAGHVYYWDGWNAFVINYVDYDISPYKVVHIGKFKDAEISSYLQSAGENIAIRVTESKM